MNLINLAWKSARARTATTLLTIFSIAISTALLLSVEKFRTGAKASFEQSVSGTDLIVGARSGSINLLLYTVFRLGDPTANVSWETYERFSNRADVAWSVPFSLGDSHQGYRVLGTNRDYFYFYRYGDKRSLSFSDGNEFKDVYDTVIGSEVAKKLHYRLGDEFDISHGIQSASFADHKDKPFKVVGILEPTGTPVDRTIHVSLAGIEAVHLGWNTGIRSIGFRPTPTSAPLNEEELTPDSITAFLVGLKSKSTVLRYQREINTYGKEALSAVIPGVALSQLWRVVGAAENALRGIAILVIAAGFIGLLTTILTSLNERRREIAVLRSVGAKSGDVFFLLVFESTWLASLGALIGLITVNLSLNLFSDEITMAVGFPLGQLGLSVFDLYITGAIIIVGFILGFIPGWLAYRRSLSEGLSIRI